MLFSRQLPLSALIELCRVLRHNLGAGLTVRDVWRQQARRGPAPVRPLADRVQEHIESGSSLASALDGERAYFPPIFLAMTEVGEETGNLPEVFAELEKFFLLQQKLRRQFYGQIAWPVIQFVAATLVIAGLILLLGLISNPSVPDDWKFAPLGRWFMGPSGAMLFLFIVYGGIAAIFTTYFVMSRMLHQQAAADGLLLKLPAVGGTLRAIAMTRFCLALRLTLETGMSLRKALRLCFRATGNEAFIARAEVACEAVRAGEELTVALTETGMFPRDFLDIMANAEEGGRVAEAMRHQADYYEEEATRRMTILTRVAGFGVWFIVAAFIVFMIFRIMLYYIGMLDPGKYGL
jgi:type II secretory pathway component PulF